MNLHKSTMFRITFNPRLQTWKYKIIDWTNFGESTFAEIFFTEKRAQVFCLVYVFQKIAKKIVFPCMDDDKHWQAMQSA